jgi:hypothetical protein
MACAAAMTAYAPYLHPQRGHRAGVVMEMTGVVMEMAGVVRAVAKVGMVASRAYMMYFYFCKTVSFFFLKQNLNLCREELVMALYTFNIYKY